MLNLQSVKGVLITVNGDGSCNVYNIPEGDITAQGQRGFGEPTQTQADITLLDALNETRNELSQQGAV